MRPTRHLFLLCLLAVVMVTTGGRSGGGRSGGGSRSGGGGRSGGWGSSGSSSRTSGSSSWGSSGSSRTSGSSSWGSSNSGRGTGTSYGGYGSRTGSSGSSGYGTHSSGSSGTSNIGWHSSVTNTKPKPITTSNTHSTSHILPLSTGARAPIKPTTSNGGGHSPSAPPYPGPGISTGSNSHAPSAPSVPSAPGGNKPPGPGWNPGATSDVAHRQHVTNSQSSYPGQGPSAPSAPGANKPPGPGWNPGVTSDAAHRQHVANTHTSPPVPSAPGANNPPAPGWNPGVTSDAAHRQHISTTNNQNPYPGAPPPYPGTNTHYPNVPPPAYGAGHYPQQPPPAYPGHYPAPGGSHYPPPPAYYPQQGAHQPYPVQHGGPVYYPPAPPPPPGFSPYGTTYYKDRSGIRGSDVVAGLAMWELMRHSHHRHGYSSVQQVHHHHYNEGTGGDSYVSTSYSQPSYHDAMRERYTTRITPSTRTSSGPGAYNILEMTHYITPDEKGEIYSSEGNMTCISVYNARSVSNWHQQQVNDFKRQFPDSVYPLYRLENDTTSENFTIVPGRIIHREPVSITCCGTGKGRVDLNLLTNGKDPNVNCVNHVGHIPIMKLMFIRTNEVKPEPSGPWHSIELHSPNVTTSTPPFSTNWTVPVNVSAVANATTPTPLLLVPFLNSSSPVPPVVASTAFPVDLNQTFSPLQVNNSTESVGIIKDSNVTTDSPLDVTNNPSELIVG